MYSRNKQSGVVLLVSLLILLVITLVGFSVMATSNLEVKMASTKELKAISYQAAEAIIDEVLTEPAAVNILGQSLNAYLADPNDPSWPNDTGYAYPGYDSDSGSRNVQAGGESTVRFLGTASTLGYSIRKGSSGIDTYYYEAESVGQTSNDNINSTHVQGVFVEAPRLN